MKTKKNGIIVMTLVSALLFCLLIVTASLSPVADTGPKANQFNTLGMWMAVGTILVFYLFPLIVYMLGVKAMKIVMAVFCAIGLLINLSVMAVMIVMGAVGDYSISSLMGVTVFCIASLIVNVVWFFSAFRSPSTFQKAL
ncbi:DUF5391 family protein [Bacillus atrophaeus]|uniref:DUF5391 family protein n=1 Tax=Bacillus atrophaeus TaxID=1452 RepID=UPI00227FD19E|nr:DUF5391 family protein [Bacillus atrophaeus]MCY8512762.1 DUF5391 domain-containing protein [Bacillus atrophaeus]MCY8991025.1 DUF5391 domain-containing protein [Bacillus atrophaeus]